MERTQPSPRLTLLDSIFLTLTNRTRRLPGSLDSWANSRCYPLNSDIDQTVGPDGMS